MGEGQLICSMFVVLYFFEVCHLFCFVVSLPYLTFSCFRIFLDCWYLSCFLCFRFCSACGCGREESTTYKFSSTIEVGTIDLKECSKSQAPNNPRTCEQKNKSGQTKTQQNTTTQGKLTSYNKLGVQQPTAEALPQNASAHFMLPPHIGPPPTP